MREETWQDWIGLLPGYDPWATAGPAEFVEERAGHAVAFFEEALHHVKGPMAGHRFVLERWQKAVVGNAFGWIRPDGTRRYRRVFLYVPRKNGKTTLAAGLVLYALLCDDEPGAEIYSAAAKREQAALVFEQAVGMVRREPALSERTTVYAHSIVRNDHLGYYKTISAEAHTAHGFNTHFCVVDELHAQPNRRLVDALETSTGSRRQPLVVYITTADYDRPSICNDTLAYAKRVRDNRGDPEQVGYDQEFLPAIWETSPTEDWQSPAVWRKANPNLGVSLTFDYLQRQCGRAKESAEFENTFKRLHLNVKTEQAERWLRMDRWDRGAEGVDRAGLKGKECMAGLDLGATSDLTSLCLLFREAEEDEEGGRPEWRYTALWWHWVPKDTARIREERDRVPYEAWARAGWIELTEGDETDYRHIRRRVNEIAQEFGIVEVAADRLFQGAQLCQDLGDDGFEVVPFGMGFMSMPAPMQEFERKVNRGELRHGGNPVLRWMAGNIAVKRNEMDCIKPDKKRSGDKIDGIVSAVIALGRWLDRDEAKGSVYDQRGLEMI